MTIVYKEAPRDFRPTMHIAACFVEWDGRLLLLQANPKKAEPYTWGVPAGKVEVGELCDAAAARELMEETGILAKPVYLGALYMRKVDLDYVFNMYRAQFDEKPEVILSQEHLAYMWTSESDREQLHLMEGAVDALAYYVTV